MPTLGTPERRVGSRVDRWEVISADEAVASVQAPGGRVDVPATDVPYSRFTWVTDPWGVALSVMQLPT